MELPGEKLVIKLWETLVEKGMGSLLSPWQAGREGRARIEIRRDELLILAQAEADAADIRSGRKQLRSDGTLRITNETNELLGGGERVEPFFALSLAVESGKRAEVAASARSEINSAKAILFAEEQLSSEINPLPEKDIEEDWLFTWRELAGRVSSEELQRLWGSVLAGELKAPGRYSIRTLDFLRTLSKADAELISMLAKYVIDSRIAKFNGDDLNPKEFSYDSLLAAQELGVLSGIETGILSTYRSITKDSFFCVLPSHNKVIVVRHSDPSKTLAFNVYLLTTVGREVIELGSFDPDVEYMRRVGNEFLGQGFDVSIADWQAIPGVGGKYSNEQPLERNSIQ